MTHDSTGITYKEDDTSPVLSDTLTRDGSAIDVSNANEVRFYLRQYATGDLVVNDATNVTITDGANGEVEYQFQTGDLGAPGYYEGEWRIEFADSTVQRVPESGYISIEVDDALGTVGAATIEDEDLTLANLTVGSSFSLGNDGPATSFSDITNATDVELQDNGTTLTTNLDILNFVAGFDITEPVADEIDVSFDETTLSNIPNSSLANDSVTITSGNAMTGGGSVALGGSLTLNVDESAVDLANVAGDTDDIGEGVSNLFYTDERAQDAVGNILTGDFTYNDAGPSIDLANDSVTVTAGNGLSGGGSVSLGGSTTVDIATGGVDLTELASPFAMTSLLVTPFDVGNNDIDSSSGSKLYNASGGPSNQGELVARVNTAYASADEIFLPDAGVSPTANGSLWRNSTDVLVRTGGSTKNLSDIGSASGAAPSDAGYLVTASDPDLSNEQVVNYPLQSADLATGSVTASEIATGAVTTTEVLDGTLTQSDWDTESFQDEVGSMAGTDLVYDDTAGVINSTASSTGTEYTQVNATNDYNAGVDESIWADGSSNPVDVTAPSPNKSDHFRVLAVDTTNAVTVSENATEGLNDQSGSQSQITLNTGESLEFESNGTTWWVV